MLVEVQTNGTANNTGSSRREPAVANGGASAIARNARRRHGENGETARRAAVVTRRVREARVNIQARTAIACVTYTRAEAVAAM